MPTLWSSSLLDTAADISNISLIITVDTVTAHIAGALGRPVWLLLPFRADWRWMLSRIDSPWYPSMRIFRQPVDGEWEPIIEQVATALASWKIGARYACSHNLEPRR
jgi:ADP-heptose:LPS heptosyltransferase